MSYPSIRSRRLRKNKTIRAMLTETNVSVNQLIQPLFIIDGKNKVEPIQTMPNINRFSIDTLLKEINVLQRLGVNTICLFPNIENSLKTAGAEEAYNPDGLVQRALREIKKEFNEINVMTDVALDPFTIHGQDGLIDNEGIILNDETLEILCHQALSLVQAGSDIIGPSDMMDGRIGQIRKTLEKSNYCDTVIISYAAKFASTFYSPFREAVGSNKALKRKGKESYQINPANGNEAIIDALLDIEEGADILMVKPGLPYLDIVAKLKNETSLPLASYHTSGEYSMQKKAILDNIIPASTVEETLTSFCRAGAQCILTYFAKEFAQSKQ